MRKSILFIAILILFLSIGSICAADVPLDVDTTDQINNAFNNCTVHSGDTVYLGNKTFSDTSYNAPRINLNLNNVIINGGSMGNTNSYSTFKNNVRLFNIQGANVTFLNIHFESNGNYNAYGDSDILVNSAGFIRFVNCSFENINAIAIEANSCTDFELNNCQFKNFYNDVWNKPYIIYKGTGNGNVTNTTFSNYNRPNSPIFELDAKGNSICIQDSNFINTYASVLTNFNTGTNVEEFVMKNNKFNNVNSNNPLINIGTVNNDFIFINNNFTNVGASSGLIVSGSSKNYIVSNCSFNMVTSSLFNFYQGSKVIMANNTFNNINLNYNYNLIYSNINNTDISSSSFKNITLNGCGIIKIDTNGKFSNVHNLTLDNCKIGEGIVISADDSSVKDIYFKDFVSNTDGGAVVIYTWRDVVENCTFINCSSASNGGAIYITGQYNVINNSTFIDCFTTGSGGAINIGGSNNLVNNSNFIRNVASVVSPTQYDGGGAIYANEAYNNINIQNSNFINNTGYNSGGAIRLAATGSSVLNCTFIGNHVQTGSDTIDYGGGAIWCARNPITLKDSEFYNNSAPYGGAIRGAANIDNCIFINNNATDGNGGGIDLTIDSTKEAAFNVTNSQFINNSAWGDLYNNERSQGGGLHTYHMNGCKIENCTFIDNIAARGGGIDIFEVNGAKLINNTIDNNYAIVGGGVALVGDNTNIFKNDISYNVALRGGGLYISGSNEVIKNSTMDYNVANLGGGLWISGANSTVYNSTIEWNEAVEGGGIYKEGQVLNMADALIHHNTAVLNITSNITDLVNLPIFKQYHFSFYQEGFDITAFYIPRGTLENFTYDAGLGGGVYTIGTEEGNSIINNSFLHHNTARNGSAIYTSPYHMSISNSVFYSNCAWSYYLPINFKNSTINVGETLKGNVTLIGGDNLINGIYNTHGPDAFKLNNVTYEFYNGNNVVNRTTGVDEVPVDGWENSNNGTYVYQDDRENNQIINITIKNSNSTIVYETSGRSDITGNVYFETPNNLPVGDYIIDAVHKNGSPYHPNRDYYYTDISNRTNFNVVAGGYVDVGVVKQANATTVYLGDLVNWTITVTNHGNIQATNVVLKDFLPNGLIFVNASSNAYNIVNGNWTIGNLDAGASVILTITTKVNKTGSITNVANVTTESEDINPNNNVDNDTIEVLFVDVGITKTVNVTEVHPGDLVTWTITVKNYGTGLSIAENVKVTDVIPNNLQVISTTPGSAIVNNTWTIGNLPANYTMTLIIVTKVLATEATNITNNVNVTTTSKDTNISNNKDNATIKVIPIVDLAINKTVNVTSVHPNDYVTWTITVINNGPSKAENVVVNDIIPNGLELISANATRGTYNNGVWTIGDLSADGTATLTLITKTNVTGNITNKVNVTTTSNDTNESNNKDNATVEVLPIISIDLGITKVANVTDVVPGDSVTWTITLTNYGNYTAKNVIVIDSIPSGLIFVSASPTSGSYQFGVWTIDELKVNETATLTIITKVSETKEANLTNIVVVYLNDTNPYNNIANDTITVHPICDVEISKIANVSDVYSGDSVTWTIAVVNHGPSWANDVVVNDVLPEGLELTSYEASVGTFANGVWTIGNLESSKSVTLTLVTKIKATTAVNITNSVNVTTTSNDTNKSNNKANSTVEVTPICDLAVNVTVNQTIVNKGDVISWNVTINNYGPSVGENTNVTIKLPDGVEFVDVIVPSGTSYDNVTHIWTVGNLTVNQNLTLIVITKVKDNATGDLTFNANITTSTMESDYTNNVDNDTAKVIPDKTNLKVTKVADKESYYVGDTVKWIITIYNTGNITAVNVRASDMLPAGMKFVSYNANMGTFDPNTGVWTVGDLEAGKIAYLELYSIATVAGEFTNFVNVTSDTPEISYDDNFANFTVSVKKHKVPSNESNGTGIPGCNLDSGVMLKTGNPVLVLLLALLFSLIGFRQRKE